MSYVSNIKKREGKHKRNYIIITYRSDKLEKVKLEQLVK